MARYKYDGAKLAKDVDQFRAIEQSSQDSTKASLMNVVEQLHSFITSRSSRGWSKVMIADLLTEAGYNISAGTLRSYLKRIRDREAECPAAPVEAVTVQTDHAAMPDRHSRRLAIPASAMERTRSSPARESDLNEQDEEPMRPPSPSAHVAKISKSFPIDRANVKPDHA